MNRFEPAAVPGTGTHLFPSHRPQGLQRLGLGVAAALGLALLSGWSAAHGHWSGAAAAGGAAALLVVQSLRAIQARVVGTLAQSSQALRHLARGDVRFRLDSQGLHEFDELLLAIDDLREVIVPTEPAPPARRGTPTTPAGESPGHGHGAAWA